MPKSVALSNSRGAQEGIFAELKSQTQMDFMFRPEDKRESGVCTAAMLVHNLNREMQMLTNEQQCATTERRTAVALYTARHSAASTDSASRTADQAQGTFDFDG